MYHDPGESGGPKPKPRRHQHIRPEPAHESSHTPAPQGDVQSSGGNYGLPQARHAQRSNPTVRHNTRFVYQQQPQAQRSRISRVTRGRSDAVSRQIQHEHQSRVARNRELARSLALNPGGGDMPRAQKYLAAHPEILHPKTKQKSSDIFLSSPAALKAAGFKPQHEGLVTSPIRVPLTLAKSALYTGETAATHPNQIPKLGKDLAESVLSIPAGLIRTGLHPVKAAEAIGKDYSRRYGGIYNNKPGAKQQFQKRQQKEGILPEVLDLSTVASAGGATLGRGLQKVAEAGTIGKTAERIAAKERPRLQTSGQAVEQDKSKNFFGNIVHAATDTARAKHDARVVARAKGHEGTAPVEPVEAVRRTDKGIPTVAPLTRYGAHKAQRMAIARRKGRAITHQKVEQQTADHATYHAYNGVDEHAFKYATQYGIRSSAQAKQVLTDLRAHIEANRKTHKREIPTKQDELPQIQRLLDNPQVFDDPKLHQAVEDMGKLTRKVAEQSPGITPEEAAARRIAPQAELQGVVRRKGETNAEFLKRAEARRLDLEPVTDAENAAVATYHGSKGQAINALLRNHGGNVVDLKRAAASIPDHEAVAARIDSAIAKQPATKADMVVHRGLDATGFDADHMQVGRVVTDKGFQSTSMNEAQATFFAGNKKPVVATIHVPKGSHVLKRTDPNSAEQEVILPRNAQMRVVAREDNVPLSGSRTGTRVTLEYIPGKHTGSLAPGEYFPSAKRAEGSFLYRTTGGASAQADVKGYTGALTRTGRENASREVFLNAIHKEIRRKHNWNLVAKTFEEHTLPWSRDKTLSHLQDQVDARHINPESIAYVNLRKIRTAQQLEDFGAGSAHHDTSFGTADSQIEQLLNESFVNPKNISTHREDFSSTGWAIVPKEVANELKSGFKQSSLFGRVWRVGKGKTSRVLLSNPVWLQFQIASNAMMAGAHRTGLISVLKAHYKFRQPEWRAIQNDIGIHSFYDDQAKLGAAVTNNAILNGWRAWQKVGAGSKLGMSAHPVREFFNIFHRADTAQNNLFRRAVFYNDVKREAYRQMAASAGHMTTAQARIANTLALHDPQRIMDAIIHDPKQFERHAQALDDFMGNWTTYTSKERAILGNALFGGFIRFSTKLAFYTMPMKHPIMASIITQMGRLEKDELHRIFGTDVPPWEVGNYYSSDGKAKFQAIRLNPFANALTGLADAGVSQSVVGSLSPVIGMMLDQLAKGNVGFQQPWTVGGKQVQINTPVKASDRLKILVETFLSLSPYYRDVEKYGIPGVVKPVRGRQNSTSSLLFPSPRKYDVANSKRPATTQAALDRNNALKREQAKANPLSALSPFVHQPGKDTILKAQQFAAAQGKGKKSTAHQPGAYSLSGGGTSHTPGAYSLGGGNAAHKPGAYSLTK